ncbi:TPA: hypothetical protein N0F65_007871, partial [Lagenidium giganteum]
QKNIRFGSPPPAHQRIYKMAAFTPLHGASYSDNTNAVCIGSGRFLRTILVPTLRALGGSVVIAQTRGTDFVETCRKAVGIYEIDEMDRQGKISTKAVTVEAVGSLGVPGDRSAFMTVPSKLPQLRWIGVGVTEGGIVPGSQAMRDLAEFLYNCSVALPNNTLSVINTDNMPSNGTLIKKYVLEADWTGKPADTVAFAQYVNTHVHFHNTMVDRITGYRPGNPYVPLTEPSPTKELVLEDLAQVLDAAKMQTIPGVVIRTKPGQLELDHMLKVGVANGVHTAVVYLMALSRMKNTTELIQHPTIRRYLDQLYRNDIRPALLAVGIEKDEIEAMYVEWMARVEHPFFGLDTFFICQNAMIKYGVRLFRTVTTNVAHNPSYRPSVFMAFATAALLRFLTPVQADSRKEGRSNVFVGELDPIQDHTPIYSTTEKTWVYANGLTANISSGKYEFLDGDEGKVASLLFRATRSVQNASKSSSNTFTKPATTESAAESSAGLGIAVATALSTVNGFDLTNEVYASFAADVAALYQRLILGRDSSGRTALDVLDDVMRNASASEYLGTKDELAAFVRETVATVPVIDVHTHLFPPTHGKLMLWGINELLTYHYLVAEYLMTAPMEVEEFNSYPKEEQARLIWQHLFVDRSPISEACRGVITTLQALGLGHLMEKRDLPALQEWFKQQNAEEYVDTVFRLAGLKYAVMTNIPFEPEEARHWLGESPPKWSRKYFRSALRVDQILLGDWKSIAPSLDAFQLPHTLEGCRTLLVKWIDIMKPEYFMSSVPIHFEYPPDNAPATPANELPTGADLLLKVLLPLAEEKKLPIALKFDSVRPINACLGVAGDGVKPSDVDILIKLCRRFPRVKFLATFLSRVNQHEVTVTANKFRNLHLYGCWWYCNNPSIIEEMTRMRIEILGTAFTSQHSDARVLDQLIYKWKHSREIIGDILVDMYDKMANTGWKISKADVERDVERLFGGSYEEFMTKA